MRQWILLALAIIFLGTTLLFGKLHLNDKHQFSTSDNTAAYTIFTSIQGLLPSSDQSLNNLDVQTMAGSSSPGTDVTLTARSYSSVLQCLYYFPAFLNYPDSEAILGNLSNGSTDNSRIRAGLPGDVTVARKLGSFGDLSQSDCGIVYIPNKNYVLCIMLDENSDSANKEISNLSKIGLQLYQ